MNLYHHKPEEQTLPNVKPYNNLSCVLVLPQYQRQGFGHMLIDFIPPHKLRSVLEDAKLLFFPPRFVRHFCPATIFLHTNLVMTLRDISYLLSRVENRLGTPERPLSDQGLLAYRRYWKYILLSFLLSHQERSISFDDISEATGIVTKDIIQTLLDMGMFKYLKSKYYIVNDRTQLFIFKNINCHICLIVEEEPPAKLTKFKRIGGDATLTSQEKIEGILSQIGQPKPDRLIDPQSLCWVTAAAPKSKEATDLEQPSPIVVVSP
ncbi:hypothetical protein ACTXT7_007364 [Hymenolepis weldensis]